MTPNEYQREAARTEADQRKAGERLLRGFVDLYALNPEDVANVRLLHGYTGVINELGEITSAVQKKFWYGKAMTDEEFRAKVKDEAGDLCWHLMQILSSQGLTFQEVLDANIAKLKARYPDAGWTQQACENRDRDAEAAAQQGLDDHLVRLAHSKAEQDHSKEKQ